MLRYGFSTLLASARLRSQPLTELRRRDAHDSAENFGEVALVRESGRLCNLADPEFGAPEECLRTVDPAPQQVLMGT